MSVSTQTRTHGISVGRRNNESGILGASPWSFKPCRTHPVVRALGAAGLGDLGEPVAYD